MPVLEVWFLSTMATWIAAALAVYVLLYQYSTRKLDAREPPIIASAIPFVGHTLGMAFYGGKYIKDLGCGHLT
jgi:hypothetical protein